MPSSFEKKVNENEPVPIMKPFVSKRPGMPINTRIIELYERIGRDFFSWSYHSVIALE